MAKTILTKRQQNLLTQLEKDKNITNNFYLSGSTALSEYYLHHRYSESLDFFSFKEVNPLAIQIVLKTLSTKIGFEKIDFQQSFNRNLFFLHFPDGEVIKSEFTYYPFTQIELPQMINDLKIDSLLDISINKAFTIYQMPRMRDFIGLYFIYKKNGWTYQELLYKARAKFESPIDSLQAAKQLLQVDLLKDFPRMIIELSTNDLHDFWMQQIQILKGKVVE